MRLSALRFPLFLWCFFFVRVVVGKARMRVHRENVSCCPSSFEGRFAATSATVFEVKLFLVAMNVCLAR
jgi:hypothetical protein